MPFTIGHIGPHESLGPFNPFQFFSTPTKRGVRFGTMENGQSFYMAPHKWMKAGLTGGTSIQYFGHRDSGKTTAAQVFARRMSGLDVVPGQPYRISVDDTRNNAGRPEYEQFARTLGSKLIDLSREKLNPLDPKMLMSVKEQHRSIRTLMESINNDTRLTLTERIGLLTALQVLDLEMSEDASIEVLREITMTLKFSDFILMKNASTARTLESMKSESGRKRLKQRVERSANFSEAEFEHACKTLTEILTVLLEEYEGLFGGTASLYDVLNDPVVALSFTGLDDETIPLVEMMLWMFRNAAVRRHDHNLMAHIEIHDENWNRWQRLLYGENMVARLKKIRGSGIIVQKVYHRPSDALQAGPVGSRQYALAMSGLRETDVYVIGFLKREDLDSLQAVVNLPKKYLDAVPLLGQGDFIVKIGEKVPPVQIHLDITEDEKQMSETNQALSSIAG